MLYRSTWITITKYQGLFSLNSKETIFSDFWSPDNSHVIRKANLEDWGPTFMISFNFTFLDHMWLHCRLGGDHKLQRDTASLLSTMATSKFHHIWQIIISELDFTLEDQLDGHISADNPGLRTWVEDTSPEMLGFRSV